MRIGVLALQGAFAEHEEALTGLGVTCVEVRQGRDFGDDLDGIVIPGGESTVMTKLLHDRALAEPLRRAVSDGMPVFGTCAGMIMLARKVEERGSGCLPVLDVIVRRNAFGRQLGSFRTEGTFLGIGTIPMTFIRAPFVVAAGPDVEVLATVEGGAASTAAGDGRIVAVRQGSVLATAFHPELTGDVRVHEYFIERLCAAR